MTTLHSKGLEAILNKPNDTVDRLILADLRDDIGLPTTWWRETIPPPPNFYLSGCNGYGDGYGNGYGNGDGYGYGDGDGYGYGDGNGNGDGDGDGYGYGYGYGDGYGYGYGNGDGYGNIIKGTSKMPHIGFNQLIVLSDGWVICGFVLKAGDMPFQFIVENASIICNTGGTPWDELADGKGREGAAFRKWGTVTIGPNPVMSREWKGELP
jgi:hypothetical protein